MGVLALFAFIAGVVTILSPCVLPVLPIVLSGAVGGQRRPWGIVTGFVVSFSLFTLLLSAAVRALGISADGLRLGAILVIGLFGLSLVVPAWSAAFERSMSRLSRHAALPTGMTPSGYWGGVLVGCSLGAVWTPCVGPILASVISLSFTSGATGAAAVVTVAYALGTALPMLGIMYGGRAALVRVPWLTSRLELVRRVFGVALLVIAVAMAFGADRSFQTWFVNQFPSYGANLTGLEDTAAVRNRLGVLGGTAPSPTQPQSAKPMPGAPNIVAAPLAPEIIPGGEWFNSQPLTLAGLRGKVVLVDFWTYTCINCIRTLPYIQSWHERYADQGLVIIGVHTPEFAFEKNADNVADAIKRFGLTYPIVQDNDYATWQAYQNHYWPAKYFIDRQGRVRSTHFGEGDYDESEQIIQELLAEDGSVVDRPVENPSYTVDARTPELYLGAGRMSALSSPERVAIHTTQTYSLPATLGRSRFAYGGRWQIGDEYAAASAGATLRLRFDARRVFLVMRPQAVGQSATVAVSLDGLPITAAGADVTNGNITVNADRLYDVVNLPERGDHTVEFTFPMGGVEVFAFTFG